MRLGNQLQRLQKSSKRAINVFTQAAKELQKNNASIQNELKTKERKIEELESGIQDLLILRATNERIIEKVEKLLS